MSGNSCENCIFQCGKRNGKMDGERLFKFEARMSGRSRIISCLSNLYYAQASFVEYSRSEKGEIDGAVIRCDLGHGYGFDDGEEVVTLHPCETHRFIHSYTDTSEGTWDDDSFSVRLTLLPFDEKECCWCAEDE